MVLCAVIRVNAVTFAAQSVGRHIHSSFATPEAIRQTVTCNRDVATVIFDLRRFISSYLFHKVSAWLEVHCQTM